MIIILSLNLFDKAYNFLLIDKGEHKFFDLFFLSIDKRWISNGRDPDNKDLYF